MIKSDDYPELDRLDCNASSAGHCFDNPLAHSYNSGQGGLTAPLTGMAAKTGRRHDMAEAEFTTYYDFR